MARDWVSIIAIAGMVLAGMVAIQFYYNTTLNSCLADPLVYGAKQLTESYGYEFHGTGFFTTEQNAPIVYFSPYNSTIKYRNQMSAEDIDWSSIKIID